MSQSRINCSDTEMMEMLQGMIDVHQFPLAINNSIPTASGWVSMHDACTMNSVMHELCFTFSNTVSG